MQLNLLPMRAMFALLNFAAPSASGKMAQRLYTMPPRKTRQMSPAERSFFEQAQALTIPYPSHPLRAWRAGPEDGKQVLLVHGWGGAPVMYVPLAARLIALGYRVICYEAPGHGKHPEQYTSPMGFADSVRAMLDAIGPVYAIIGHSIGAGAIVMASKRGLQTEHLVLLSPLTRVVDHTNRFAAQLGISGKAIAHMRKLVWNYAEPSSSVYGDDWDSVYTAAERFQTLIVHDEKDGFMPFANAEWLLEKWPRSRLFKTAGVSHGRVVRDTAVMNEVCRFLAGSGAVSASVAVSERPAKNHGNKPDVTWIDTRRLQGRDAQFKKGWPAHTRTGIEFLDTPLASFRLRRSGVRKHGDPTVILICDPPNVIEHFDRLIGLLEQRARVVCFEPPGFGFSIPGKAFHFTFDHYRAAIEELLEKLQEGPYLLALPCVWSHIALQIAARKPDDVAKLMLWQSPAWDEQVKWARHVDANNILGTPVAGQLATALAAHSIGRSWHKTAMAKGRYTEFAAPMNHALQHGACCCLGSLWQQFYGIAPPPVQVTQPALITWGVADRTHRNSDKLSILRQVPHAVVHDFFTEAGHCPELEDSEGFARLLLDWLDAAGHTQAQRHFAAG